MSFSATLEFGSDKYVILDVDYEFSQSLDPHNMPNCKPKGGIMNLSVESSKKNDLLEWMLAPDMKKTGTITFSKRDSEAILKTIQFDDAYCVRYRERFSSTSNSPMILSLTISAGHISINNKFSMKNSWSTVLSKVGGIGVDAIEASVAGFDPKDISKKDMLHHPNRVLDDMDLGKGASKLGSEGKDYVGELDESGAVDLHFFDKRDGQSKPTDFKSDNKSGKNNENTKSTLQETDGLPGVSFS